MTIWARRDFRTKPTEIIKQETKDKLQFKGLAFLSAKAKYKFNIFSMKDGSISRYRMSRTLLQYPWKQLLEKPGSVTFEEAKTKDKFILRLMKDQIEEKDIRGNYQLEMPRYGDKQ